MIEGCGETFICGQFCQELDMKLLWILYKGKQHTRYILFLNLGVKGNKLIGLDTKLVDDNSRMKIMEDKHFPNLSLDAKMAWLRKHCPAALNAYRELLKSRIASNTEYMRK